MNDSDNSSNDKTTTSHEITTDATGTETDAAAAVAVAAAAALPVEDDAVVARKLYAVDQLTNIYGFPVDVAEEAVDWYVNTTTTHNNDNSNSIDITACYNYILDSNPGSDHGGPVVPIDDCPHVARHCCITIQQLPILPGSVVCSYNNIASASSSTVQPPTGALKSETYNDEDDDGVAASSTTTCGATENWLCLECAVVRCSRYCNGHALQHWNETKKIPPTTTTNSDLPGAATQILETSSNGTAAPVFDGHCVMASLSDLSVWCHVCNAYLSTSTGSTGTVLRPILMQLEALKFMTSADDDVQHTTTTIVLQEPIKKKHKTVMENKTTISNGDISRTASNSEADEKTEEQDCPAESSSEEQEEVDNDTEYDDEDNEQENANDADDDDDDNSEAEDLLRRLSVIAAARGIPLEWLVLQACQENQDGTDDEPVEYPFDTLPTSLEDVANFIQSDKCRSILILAGAGMSVASGIPDFRSADGLYATLNPDLLTADVSEREAIRADPTVSLQQDMFLQNPLPCLELQREFILGTRSQRWKATLAHRFIELLHEKTGKLVRHYTQNIDGLEDQCTKLPRDKVIAVHGSMDRAECARCQSEADFNEFCDRVQRQIKDLSGKDPLAPSESTAIECKVCGFAAMKPSIVLFKSSLPKAFFENVPQDIQNVDLLIVMGTSLRVAPACSLVPQVPKSTMRLLVNREAAGEHLGMILDPSYSQRDYFAQGDCDAVLLELMDHLGWIEELKPLLSQNLLPESSAKLLQDHFDNLEKAM